MNAGGGTRRTIAALRAGRAIRIEADRPLTVLSVEAGADMLALLDREASASLLLSGHRAAALSLANEREAADPARPVLVERAGWLDASAALTLVDPALDFARAPIGPLKPVPLEAGDAATAALKLARRAGLLPALWVLDDDTTGESIGLAELRSDELQPQVELVARARIPLENLPAAQMVAFRASDDGQEHVALLVGAFGGEPPLVRLHSECLTGDVFGSLKCDCGPQLTEALLLIGEAGGGVLLYLRQEGRGIGLANKLRAYALQERGLDTVEANLRLGFSDDERDYLHAAAMLKALGIDRVRLLTNNPAKVEGLREAGIDVAERVPHQMPTNPHNADYVATKRQKSGHLP